MTSRTFIALLVVLAVSCVSTPHHSFDGLAIELPAPYGCKVFKGSVLVGAGGIVTLIGLSINGVQGDESFFASAGLVAALGGGIAAGLTSRGCFRQMSNAAERISYRPPTMSPEQKAQLDAVRTVEHQNTEAKP